MCNIRLDARSRFPSGMEEYLENYGWTFSKKLCEHAVSKMRDRSGNKISPYTREAVDQLMAKFGIRLENDKGYDAVYVANMAKADYWGGSLNDERQLAFFVRDYIDDEDGYTGKALTRYYADSIGSGCPIPWEDVL